MTTVNLSSAVGTKKARAGFLSRPPGLCAVGCGRALVLALTGCLAVGSFAGRGERNYYFMSSNKVIIII